MAIVTGYSAEKMNEFNNASVIGGSVNTTGNLILKTRAGTNIDAGVVKGAKGDPGPSVTAAQLAEFVPKWKSGTSYIAGYQVVAPNNKLMTANVNHIAGNFNTDVAKWNGVTSAEPYGHMGRTGGSQSLGGVVTRVPMDEAQELRGGMTFDNANDALIIPVTGRYLVRLKAFFAGAASDFNHAMIMVNGKIDFLAMYQKLNSASPKPTGADIAIHSSGVVSFAANDKVALAQSSNVSAWGTNGYNGSNIEIIYWGAP